MRTKSNKPRSLRAVLATTASAAALLAITGGTAVAATWSSSTGQVHGTGSLTISDGMSSKICNVTLSGSAWSGGGALWPLGSHLVQGPCNQGQFQLSATLFAAESDGSLSAWTYPGYGHSPYGDFDPAFEVPASNPAGGQPAKLQFSNTSLGYTHTGWELTATGTLDLSNGTGGSIAIIP